MSLFSFAKGSEWIEECLFGTLIKISKSTLAFPTTISFRTSPKTYHMANKSESF